MSVRDAWSQDVVLQAMCAAIAHQRAQGVAVDFVLATGDLAFSGKADEYALVGEFFDALCAASGVSKERVFCVPGNHDIDRDRQKLTFLGARAFLQNQSRIDAVLIPGEELESLLKRQENYRQFQRSFFIGQVRASTGDGLGYVSRFAIDDVELAIVGLDSAWLAEGGVDDHGKLLIGERQAINAIDLAQRHSPTPHIIALMVHHPPHLLQDFDRRPIQTRIDRACQFLHCGHLHEPEARATGHRRSGCLTLTAGASFSTRQSQNTYSVVTLDLLHGIRRIATHHYSTTTGDFSAVTSEEYPIEVSEANTCGIRELAAALVSYHATLAPRAHYLAALLLDQKADVPIQRHNAFTFGSAAVLEAQPDSELRRKTAAFMTFKNILRVLYGRIPLLELLNRHGIVVADYGGVLGDLCAAQQDIRERLDHLESEAALLGNEQRPESFSHVVALFSELAEAHEWALLRSQAERNVGSSDPTVSLQARRMLALSLAHSDEEDDKVRAIDLYCALLGGESVHPADAGNLATLLIDSGRAEEAKAMVLNSIARFPQSYTDQFRHIGQRIVEATGDRPFRTRLEAAVVERGNRD